MTSSAACGSSSRTCSLFIPLTRASSLGGIVGDAFADHAAVDGDVDRVAGGEVALDGDDADRQQAGAALAQDAGGAGVDRDPPPRRLRVLEPELEARGLAALGGEARADRLAGSGGGQRPRTVPLQITAGMPASLAISAAATLLRMPPEPKAEVRSPICQPGQLREVGHLGDQLGGRVDARVGGVEAVDVGQQDQQPGVEQDRHLGGEEVVVAEGDLVGGGGVVLVDHRHHAPLDQPPQRLARVQVVGAGGDVGGGQQHLRRPRAAPGQPALVGAEEVALADRRGTLQLVHRPRAHRQLHQPHPARDRPRGDHHHPLAALLQRAHLLADGVEHVGAQLAVIGGDDRGTELDDQGHGEQSSRDGSGDRLGSAGGKLARHRGAALLCPPLVAAAGRPRPRFRRRRPDQRRQLRAGPGGPRGRRRRRDRGRPRRSARSPTSCSTG